MSVRPGIKTQIVKIFRKSAAGGTVAGGAGEAVISYGPTSFPTTVPRFCPRACGYECHPLGSFRALYRGNYARIQLAAMAIWYAYGELGLDEIQKQLTSILDDVHAAWDADYTDMSEMSRQMTLWHLISTDSVLHQKSQGPAADAGCRPRMREITESGTPANAVENVWMVAGAVAAVMQSLSPAERTIFMCRFLGGVPHAVISRHMQLNSGSFETPIGGMAETLIAELGERGFRLPLLAMPGDIGGR